VSGVGNENPNITRTDEGVLSLTETGKAAIETWVTDVDSNVYAFTPEADSLAVAAAMARLSRNSNSLQTIIADEFLDKENRDSDLLHRVVTEYGDDSVMQLYPMQMVFEGISNIATKEVEWGRLAAYLEQSTRYLRFDIKDTAGRYSYYSPTEFDAKTLAEYESATTEIFDIYSALYQKVYAYIEKSSDTPEKERTGGWRRAVHAQACDGVRALLPASTKATVGVVGSAMYNMILNMESHELPEINELARKTLAAARGVAPVFFERIDKPDRGGLISGNKTTARDNSQELATALLGEEAMPNQGPSAEIVHVNGSEDDLVAKILVDSSAVSYSYAVATVTKLSADEKQSVIDTYVGDRYNRRVKPGRAFEAIDYMIEGRIDYGGFRDIQRSRMVDAFDWQPLGVRLGHVKPAIIDEAGLTEEYEKAFALSEKLHAFLIEQGYRDQAQYATLFGHVMRFTMKVNARSLVHTIELRTTPQGHPAYRKFYQDVHDQIAKIHPAIARTMTFVSKSEDEALARLGAERQNEARQSAREK
jgi:thymidylate synthase ThyX